MRTIARVLALALLLTAPSALATTVIRVSLKTMTLASDVIVHGKVTSSRPVTVDGNPRHIRTETTLAVTAVVKGPRDLREITLRLPGGRVGQYAMKVPGMPTFTPGEEVVLFLEKTSQGYAIAGLNQGRYTVKTTDDGRHLVSRRLDGLHFMAYDAKGVLAPVEAPVDRADQTVESLLGEVRHILKAARTQEP